MNFTTELEKDLYIDLLNHYIDDLETENVLLQIQNQIKKIREVLPDPTIIHPFDKNNCPTCGIKLNQVMGYCCPTLNCPTGLGPVMCSTSTTS